MMKKSKLLVIYLLCGTIFFSSCQGEKGTVGDSGDRTTSEETVYQEAEDKEEYDNPIDAYFLPAFQEEDLLPADVSALEQAYFLAWQSEYENLIQWMLDKCKYSQDRKQIKKYDRQLQKYTGLF